MVRQTLSNPVFVLGCQRSGTTLLCAILNRHPALYVVNELPWDSYDNLGGKADNLEVLTALLSKHQALPNLSELLSGVVPATGFEILETVLGAKTNSMAKSVWGIKDPRLTYFFPRFMSRYPKAKSILIIRDCRATAASIIKRKMHVANVYHAAKLWTSEIALQQQLIERYEEQIFVVRYEEFVKAPESHTKRMCDFLGLDFVESMLDPSQKIPINLNSANINVTKPISSEGIHRWKKTLSASEISVIEYLAGDHLESLSYETLGERTRPSLLARAWYDIHQFSLTNYWWQKRRRFDGLLAKLHRGSVDKSNQ